MTVRRTGALARVVAAALRTWSTALDDDRHDPTGPAAAVRLDVRQPGAWSHVGTISLTEPQSHRVLGFLRRDVAERTPRPCSAAQAVHLIDGHLSQARAAGRRTIRVAELLDLAHRTGRSKEWLAAHLVHLIDAGHLRETWRAGVYRLTTPPAWAVRPGTTLTARRSTR